MEAGKLICTDTTFPWGVRFWNGFSQSWEYVVFETEQAAFDFQRSVQEKGWTADLLPNEPGFSSEVKF